MYNTGMQDSIVPVQPENVEVLATDAVEEFPWHQADGEPDFWYSRFIKYFLPQGPGRSLYKSYQLMVATEHEDVAKARKASGRKETTTSIRPWTEAASKWDWRIRSRAFDKFTYAAASANVDLARITLLESADKAAKALVDALGNARLSVAAAKEILDRVGLPGTTNVALGPIEKFTADEFRQAESEVDEWERQLPSPKSE